MKRTMLLDDTERQIIRVRRSYEKETGSLLRRNAEFLEHAVASIGEIETAKLLSEVSARRAHSMWSCQGSDWTMIAAQVLSCSRMLKTFADTLPGSNEQLRDAYLELQMNAKMEAQRR